MQLHIGDKVSFLNEKGGGVITRFINDATAMVETTDGFEIPYAIKELVPENYAANKIARVATARPTLDMDDTTKAATLAEGIYLCFVPDSLDDLSSARFSVYIYNNNRKYDILFNLFSKNTAGHTLLASDRLLAGKSVAIDNLPAGSLDKYTGGVLQILFYSGVVDEVKEPETVTFKMKTLKLIDKINYSKLVHFNAQGLATALYPKRNEAQSQADYDLEDLKTKFDKGSSKPINKPKQQVFEMEVDLHIEELVDDIRGMSNGEMLQMQLDHTRRKLDEAISRNCRRLILIHGVGNGRLKTEIRALLDNYVGLEYYDASYARYGVGATEVKLGNVRLT